MHLHFAPIRPLVPTEEARIQAFMSPAELDRLHRIRHEPTRLAHLISRRLVRQTLSELANAADPDTPIPPAALRFQTNDFDRPSLLDPPPALQDLDFNLSHSRQLVVLATSFTHRIGIDIEPVDRTLDHDLVAERFFHPFEQAALQKLAPAERSARFLELWVLKEAWLKADGRGLTAGLHHVIFDFDSQGRPALIALPPAGGLPRDWSVALQQVDGHFLGQARRRRNLTPNDRLASPNGHLTSPKRPKKPTPKS